MSAGQIAAANGRLRDPIVTVLVVGAFAVGALTGINLPRAASGGSQLDRTPGSVTQARTFSGVAVNNMSDAARQARYGVSVKPQTFSGVAVNNMADAAYATLHGSRTFFAGVADNNMSDAARAATRPSYAGVAANNMSDAADRARFGSK